MVPIIYSNMGITDDGGDVFSTAATGEHSSGHGLSGAENTVHEQGRIPFPR